MGITMWVSFIICIFTPIKCKGSEHSHIAIILHYFGNTSSDTQIKKSGAKGASKTDYKDGAEKILSVKIGMQPVCTTKRNIRADILNFAALN